jgi:predicted deacylase
MPGGIFHPDATKTVYLQAGIHGIELTGIPVVHEFMKEIKAHQLVYNTEYGVFRM